MRVCTSRLADRRDCPSRFPGKNIFWRSCISQRAMSVDCMQAGRRAKQRCTSAYDQYESRSTGQTVG